MGFSLLPVLSSYQTASIQKIVQIQQFYWLGGIIPKWGIFTQPISFFLFFSYCSYTPPYKGAQISRLQ